MEVEVESQRDVSSGSQEETCAWTNWITAHSLRERDLYEEMGNQLAQDEDRMIDLHGFAEWKLKSSLRDRMKWMELALSKEPEEVLEEGALLLWEEFYDQFWAAVNMKYVPRVVLMVMFRRRSKSRAKQWHSVVSRTKNVSKEQEKSKKDNRRSTGKSQKPSSKEKEWRGELSRGDRGEF